MGEAAASRNAAAAHPHNDSSVWHMNDEQLIKSRHRVKTHGEVFTPRRMVEQMLDLVRPELETGSLFVDKTFFEPAAGDGNFLVAILQRKLRAIEKRYQPKVWPTEALFALASIYAVEILEARRSAPTGRSLR
jgi:type I restriction-modification system DNA methylase subunit